MNEPIYPLCGECKHFNGQTLCSMKRFTEGKHDLAICPDFRRPDKESGLMSKCRDCGRTFLTGDYILYSALGCYCADRKNCFDKRKNMPNIKITAEVDGKIVPLNTISTESFEAIKALEKPKEIPVARLAKTFGSPRLMFKPTEDITLKVGRVYALDLRCGDLGSDWLLENDATHIDYYENVKPL